MPEIRVVCDFCDCIFFVRHQEEPRAAFCKHPEKSYYLNSNTCPLYKKQWDQDREREMLERFRKRK